MANAQCKVGTALEQQIRDALDEVKDPCSVAASVPMGLAEMGLIESIQIAEGGHVDVRLRLTSPFCEMVAYLMREATAKVCALACVTSVKVTHDSGLDWDPDRIAPEAQARRAARLQTLRSSFEIRTGVAIAVEGQA